MPPVKGISKGGLMVEELETETETEVPETSATEETPSEKPEGQVDNGAKENEEETTIEGEVEAKGETEEPSEPPKPEWWKEMGYVDEVTAVQSQKDQRAWTTKTTQENARLKRTEEAYRQFHKGELETEDIESYIREQDALAVTADKKKSELDQLWSDRVDLALERAQIKDPDIVTTENIEIIEALFAKSSKATPNEKMEDAITKFKRVRGSNLTVIKEKQKEMKKFAGQVNEQSRGRQEPAVTDHWAGSDEEFLQKSSNVAMGLP